MRGGTVHNHTTDFDENLLIRALDNAAGRIQPESLRQLPVPPGTVVKRKIWATWLTPLAAGASVALIIGIVAAVTGGIRSGDTPASRGSAEHGMPKYYAAFAGSFSVAVFSSSTGALVARLPQPDVGGPGAGQGITPIGVAAAPDDRTFYFVYGTTSGTALIYRVGISDSGAASRLTLVKGGAIPGDARGGVVVSPDGSELALLQSTGYSSGRNLDDNDRVVVFNLQTGAHRAWQGGLDRRGMAFAIQDLSWSADGRSLVFLARWVAYRSIRATYCGSQQEPTKYCDAQVRSLDVATRDGTLSRSVLLLAQAARYPVIAQAIAGPGKSDITVLVPSGPANRDLAVERVAVLSGDLQAVDYRGPYPFADAGYLIGVQLGADPSGRYLLLNDRIGPQYGWLSHGALRRLPRARGIDLVSPVSW